MNFTMLLLLMLDPPRLSNRQPFRYVVLLVIYIPASCSHKMCQEARTSLKRVLMSTMTRIRWMKMAVSQTKCLSSTSFGAKRVAWRYARSPKSTSSPSHHQKLQCHPFLIASSYYVDSHKLTQWDWKVLIPKSTRSYITYLGLKSHRRTHPSSR